jgi:hypothetical protein
MMKEAKSVLSIKGGYACAVKAAHVLRERALI